MKSIPSNKREFEITIKKCGEKKNQFDKTKSFSVEKTNNKLGIEQIKDLCFKIIDLSQKYSYEELLKKLKDL